MDDPFQMEEDYVDELEKLTSESNPDLNQLKELEQNLIDIQNFIHPKRNISSEDPFGYFNDKVKNSGTHLGEKFFICSHPEKGMTIRAIKELKKGEEFVRVHNKFFFTEKDLFHNKEMHYICQILNSKTNQLSGTINLVLSLWYEKFVKNQFSKFEWYINALPTHITLPIFYDFKNLEPLRSSFVFDRIKFYYLQSIRTYLKIRKIFFSDVHFQDVPFLWEDFMWAVQIVLSRQNKTPFGMSLIPIWDFCNHDYGVITTEYREDCLISYCMKDYKVGDEINIFYGERPFFEFFVCSGFMDNKITNFDYVIIDFSVFLPAKSEKYLKSKRSTLEKNGIINHTLRVYYCYLAKGEEGRCVEHIKSYMWLQDIFFYVKILLSEIEDLVFLGLFEKQSKGSIKENLLWDKNRKISQKMGKNAEKMSKNGQRNEAEIAAKNEEIIRLIKQTVQERIKILSCDINKMEEQISDDNYDSQFLSVLSFLKREKAIIESFYIFLRYIK